MWGGDDVVAAEERALDRRLLGEDVDCRTGSGQDAICLIEVDQPLPPALLDAVRTLPNVIQVKSMKF